MPNEPTPHEAVATLDNALSQMSLNRQGHGTLVTCLQVLVNAAGLNAPPPEGAEAPEDAVDNDVQD